ncbi:hypothetical protein NIES4071_105490 (plasmid) [Calothrix sp. NIES-4071]|nr:hypothetical protein NIES4071_105490 [Calothrix sp. NIES-4071]BAZ64967.1 hypothetical protein NIES4105_107000 [Calothrix sp. NIES-4105]
MQLMKFVLLRQILIELFLIDGDELGYYIADRRIRNYYERSHTRVIKKRT